MQHSAITIIGNTGSGKSTIAAALSQKLGAVLVPADELFKTNPFFQLAVKNRKRWSFASDTWFLLEREKLLQSVTALTAQKLVIIDSGLAMSWVYAYSRITNKYYTTSEWQLYQQLFNKVSAKLSLDSQYIYLRADIDQLLQNIKTRGREFEIDNYSAEYLQDLNQSLETFVAAQPKQHILVIDVNNQPEPQVIVQNIATALTRKLQ